ncbi:MAG: hypothetical protein ACLQGU_07780 [bacterium]
MPTPMCALTTMMKHGRTEVFSLMGGVWSFRDCDCDQQTNGPGLNGFQGHSRCLEHLSASSHVGHREEAAIEPLATVS